MEELLAILARALVDNPAAVRVNGRSTGQSLSLEIEVAAPDVGKIIGRQGRIIRALRLVAKAAAVRTGQRVMVEVRG